jgi:hypothetical protein
MISEVDNFMFNFDYWYVDQNIPNNFSMKFKKITQPVKSFREEAIRTAQYIRSVTDKPVYIAVGGGIDSELVCLSFIEAGIEFTAFTVKFTDNLNAFDIRFAEAFCKKNKIKQVIVELNPVEFFQNGIQRYIDQGYQSSGIYRYYQLFSLETVNNMGGCCVFGAGETNYHNIDNQIQLPYKSELITPLQWIKNSGNVHFARFLEATPEMSAAYHQDKLISFLAQDPGYFTNPSVLNYQPEKCVLYHHAYPDMERRPKYVGLEGIFNLKADVEARLKKQFPNVSSIYIPLSIVKEQLGI